MKSSIFLITLLWCTGAVAQVCDFRLLAEVASNYPARDSAARITEGERAIQSIADGYVQCDMRAIDAAFTDHLSKADKVDRGLLEVVYAYALAKEYLGESKVANQLYTFLTSYADSLSQLWMLSYINKVGMTLQVDAIKQLDQDVRTWIAERRIVGDDKAELLLHLSRCLEGKEKSDLFLSSIPLVDSISRPMMRQELVIGIGKSLIDIDSNIIGDWVSRYDAEFSDHHELPIYGHWKFLKTRYYIHEWKNEQALEYITSMIERDVTYGAFELNDLLERIRKGVNRQLDYYATGYGRASLHMIEVGGDSTYVETGLKVFTAIAERRLMQRLQDYSYITSSAQIPFDYNYHNQLHIADYLYQKHGCLKCLEDGIGLLDASTATGLYSSIHTIKKGKEDGQFKKAVDELKNRIDELDRLVGVEYLRALSAQQEIYSNIELSASEGWYDYIEKLRADIGLNVDTIQSELQEGDAGILAFYQTDYSVYRLLVTADTVDWYTGYPSYGETSSLVEQTTAEINELIQHPGKSKQLAQKSYEMYRVLFTGLDTLLPPNLHVVAVGALEDLPFNLLRKDSLGDAPHYLGIEHALSRQYSIRTMQMLNNLRHDPDKAQPLALAPDFSSTHESGGVGEGATKFAPLLYNQSELDYLETSSGGKYFYGREATLENYQSYVEDYGIIHLATHAISNPVDGLASKIYLTSEAGGPVAINAREIARQPINADLVTLSACETGRGGRNTAEGTVGLTRAFLAAGARTVVASNWAIEDRATAEMIKFFYDNLAAGTAPHVALRNARITYLEKHPGAHPRQWAAFDAYGGTRPITWDRSRPWHERIPDAAWAAIAVVLLLLTGWYGYCHTPNHLT